MRKATNVFTFARVQPVWDSRGGTLPVGIVANAVLKRGTVLGQISAANQNEKQQIALGGSPTGGTFMIGFDGQYSSPIAFNVTASDIQAALDAHAAIGKGNTVVTGTGPFTVEFVAGLAASPQILFTTQSFLSGGTSPGVTISRVQGGVSNGRWTAYNPSATDGRQIAKAILSVDVAADPFGQVTFGAQDSGDEHGEKHPSAPAYYEGVFNATDLIGLDATALAAIGRVVAGNASTGVISIR